MRRKNMWAGRLTAILLCTVLSAEPIAIYAEDFSDGIANTEMQDKTEIPESTERRISSGCGSGIPVR